MSKGNKATRNKALPFEFLALEGLTNSDNYGYFHITSPQTTGNTVKAVPLTRPEKGDLIEAYLFMKMTAPSDRALEVRLAIGTLDDTATPETIYSDAYMEREHRRITGRDTPFSASANNELFIDANMLPGIPKRGDAEFSSDLVVLLVEFNEGVSTANSYALNEFKFNGSVQIGLGR